MIPMDGRLNIPAVYQKPRSVPPLAGFSTFGAADAVPAISHACEVGPGTKIRAIKDLSLTAP
jgi:hypothetical protein